MYIHIRLSLSLSLYIYTHTHTHTHIRSEVKWMSFSHVQLFVTPWTTQCGILSARIMEWVAFPSPGDLFNLGIEPRSPALQVDSLPAEPQGKSRILEWVAYPFSRGPSQPRNWTRVSCIAGGFSTNWAIREASIYREIYLYV